ncbi:tyrosinase family oxidase copper chaperone [Actinosynnema sp. ALI-1.44]|uniref:tyrosinase family oxidase copper chaperone n=1 Tax=Actinosynnema sp. ALI-1.44 TaxID=1933779 RepID=UPI00143DC99D|nr:tyrosinase family oxidase copper chaperone [Actinosynnema sp. ALI-1.44]
MLNRRRLLMTSAVAVAGGVTLGWNVLVANADQEFDEIYDGRRIRGKADLLFVDGDLVHVMRNGDGSYTTSINHYESFSSLRDAAKRAVDTLGDLRPVTHAH